MNAGFPFGHDAERYISVHPAEMDTWSLWRPKACIPKGLKMPDLAV
jgi:hypothetical protein